MSLRMCGQVWRKPIASSFSSISRNVVANISLWFVGFDAPLYRAKRPCRHTSCFFRSQYCQMMILWWFRMVRANLQAWFGKLGVRTPSGQQLSEPYLLVWIAGRDILSVLPWPRLCIKVGCVSFISLDVEDVHYWSVFSITDVLRLRAPLKSWKNILISGGHPLTMLKRKTNSQAVPTEHHDTSGASYSAMLAM